MCRRLFNVLLSQPQGAACAVDRMDNYVPSLVSLQTEAYRAVLRAIAATELDWVRTSGLLQGET